MNSCLLIIDVQNGFISDKTRHILPKLEKICESELFNHIFLTKFTNEKDGPFRTILKWNKLSNPDETELHPPLTQFAEKVFEKSVYTGVSQEFIHVLQDYQIEMVVIAGIDTDCCVLTTAVDLFQNGYVPVVLTEYCASNGGIISHTSALTVLKRLIGEAHLIDGEVDVTRLKEIV